MALAIGECILGDTPRVALALRDNVARSDVDLYIGRGVDMVELRIDQFEDGPVEYVQEQLRRFSGIPRIGTVRGRAEGGGWRLDEQQRLALYRAVIPHVEAVDIEINADAIHDAVVEAAKTAEVPVIGSFHDFQKTPDENRLNEIIARGIKSGVDIVKIACHCADQQDARALTRVLLDNPEQALIVIGMGAAGAATRLFLPALGSLIVYTFLGEPTAPGQLNCDDTIRYLNTFYTQ